MARCILVTGGSRSGKSRFAQRMAESLPGPRVFVATCPVVDEEMRARIMRHRMARRAGDWSTIEETKDLAGALRRASGQAVILVDCLTLWVNNLMFEAGKKKLSESHMIRRCEEIVAACGECAGTVIFVTNEVGVGIVPDNEAARRFRDLAGRTNQEIAVASDEVFLVVCGQALKIKPQPETDFK